MQRFMMAQILVWTVALFLFKDAKAGFLGMGHAPCDGMVSEITCISDRRDVHVATCVIEGAQWIREVKLKETFSDVDCNFSLCPPTARRNRSRRKGSFGFYENAVWTSNGCQAKILVCHSVFTCDEMSTKTVTCKSMNNNENACMVGIGENETITRVVLDGVMSDVPCMYSPGPAFKGKKGAPGLYGWKDDCVWVARGCSARFRICYKEKMGGMMEAEMDNM